MPEFQLSKPAARSHPFYSLDEFARGYVEAMFFTNCDSGDEREHLANDLGVERLTRASVESIRADCSAFLSHIMPDGCTARQWLDRVADSYTDEQAGRDFWFTRQGHGVGFWDREEIDSDLYAPTPGETAGDATLGGWIVADDSAGRMEGAPAVGNIRDGLTDAAKAAGEVWPEIARGWIYHR